jgi:hypothetical protein
MPDGRWIITLLQAALSHGPLFSAQKNVNILYILQRQSPTCVEINIFALGLNYLSLKHTFYQRVEDFCF